MKQPSYKSYIQNAVNHITLACFRIYVSKSLCSGLQGQDECICISIGNPYNMRHIEAQQSSKSRGIWLIMKYVSLVSVEGKKAKYNLPFRTGLKQRLKLGTRAHSPLVYMLHMLSALIIKQFLLSSFLLNPYCVLSRLPFSQFNYHPVIPLNKNFSPL